MKTPQNGRFHQRKGVKSTFFKSTFTPFRISNAQMHHHLSLKTPPKIGVSNEKWCKKYIRIL